MERVPALNWPTNLYSDDPAAAVDYKAPAIGRLSNTKLCTCGCGKEHRNNVAQTFPSMYGHGFNVFYFLTDRCKTNWNQKRVAQ
jgi:hypothetical protein